MKVNRSTRFDTIISVRDHQKKAATRELQKILDEKQSNIDQLTTMKSEQERVLEGETYSHKANAQELQTHRAFIEKLSDSIQKKEEHLKEIESKEETKREELLERVKAKNVVEKLKEKLTEEIMKEQNHKEQQTIDMLSQRGGVK